jgi:hypothetical protein
MLTNTLRVICLQYFHDKYNNINQVPQTSDNNGKITFESPSDTGLTGCNDKLITSDCWKNKNIKFTTGFLQ